MMSSDQTPKPNINEAAVRNLPAVFLFSSPGLILRGVPRIGIAKQNWIPDQATSFVNDRGKSGMTSRGIPRQFAAG